jgi:hypothetical protein
MMTKEKRPYCKPEMERVRLTPEDAVLAGCKTEAIVGPEFTGGCSISAVCQDQRS